MSKLKKLIFTPLMLVCTIVLTLHARSAHAQIPCRYDVQIISAGPCSIFGPQPTSGMGINSNGDICGWHCACVCAKYDRAFLWTPEGGFLTLAQPPGVLGSDAFAINDNGQIAGTFVINGQGDRAFLWEHGQWLNLGTLAGGNWSEGHGINASGMIVGFWGNTSIGPSPVPCRWERGVLFDLSTILAAPKGEANSANSQGQITGWRGTSILTDARAFILDADHVTVLPPIPGGYTSIGRAINDRGDVAGTGVMNDLVSGTPTLRGFVWIDGEMTVLNPLSGYSRIFAFDINNSRQSVGYCTAIGMFDHGFIWQGGQMIDLNDLIDPEPGLIIMIANSINDAGQIAGMARLASHDVVAVVLTPVLRSIADLDSDCVVDQKDLSLLLQSWSIPPASPGCKGNSPCKADLNRDGLVNSLDLGILLVNWSIR